MIHVITKANRAPYERQLEAMFRLRHEIYVESRGWEALRRPDGREIDDYDTDETVYFLRLNDRGDILGGLRLAPTDRPHLLQDVFPHLCTGDIPCGPDIYEFTRYFVTPGYESAKVEITGQLLSAMFEFAMTRGLTAISLTCDTFFLSRILELGWEVRHLGLPRAYREGTAMAVLIPADAAHLRATRMAHGIAYPAMFELPAGVADQLDIAEAIQLSEFVTAWSRIPDAQTRDSALGFIAALGEGNADLTGGVEAIAGMLMHSQDALGRA